MTRRLDVDYTNLLASGRILEGQKALEAPRRQELDFSNQATLEAAKAARAYDNPPEILALPAPIRPDAPSSPATDYIIHPVSGPQEDIDPDYPTGADAHNPILLFEYWLKREKRAGLCPDQVKLLFRLWDDYKAVQKFYPRPQEEALNIIEPPAPGERRSRGRLPYEEKRVR